MERTISGAHHFIRFVEPSAVGSGLAKKPYGCSLRHCLRSSFSLPRAIPPDIQPSSQRGTSQGWGGG